MRTWDTSFLSLGTKQESQLCVNYLSVLMRSESRRNALIGVNPAPVDYLPTKTTIHPKGSLRFISPPFQDNADGIRESRHSPHCHAAPGRIADGLPVSYRSVTYESTVGNEPGWVRSVSGEVRRRRADSKGAGCKTTTVFEGGAITAAFRHRNKFKGPD